MGMTSNGWMSTSLEDILREPLELAMRAVNAAELALETLDGQGLMAAAFGLVVVTPGAALRQADPDAEDFAAAADRLQDTLAKLPAILGFAEVSDEHKRQAVSIARHSLSRACEALEAWSTALERRAKARAA
jgi:hypothetical protein